MEPDGLDGLTTPRSLNLHLTQYHGLSILSANTSGSQRPRADSALNDIICLKEPSCLLSGFHSHSQGRRKVHKAQTQSHSTFGG